MGSTVKNVLRIVKDPSLIRLYSYLGQERLDRKDTITDVELSHRYTI